MQAKQLSFTQITFTELSELIQSTKVVWLPETLQ